MTIVVGKLRHRITFQNYVTLEDARGGTYEDWQDYVTVWGSVVPALGREFWDARKSNSEVEGKIVIRYRDDITPDMRIMHKGRPLEILFFANRDERNRTVEIYYKEML